MASATSIRPQAGEQIDFLLVLFRPLLTVDETRYLLGEPSPQLVVDRLEDSTLRGVDISAEGEEAGRRSLRIYRYTVEHLVFRPGTKISHLPVESIFPHALPVFRREEVARILNCTTKHVGNLPLSGPQISSGASASSAERTQRITRASLIEFLNQREIKP